MAFTLLVEHVENVTQRYTRYWWNDVGKHDMTTYDMIILSFCSWQQGGMQHETHCRFLQCQGFQPIFVTSWGFKWVWLKLFKNPSEFQVRLRGNGSGYLEGSQKLEAGHWWPFWEALLSASQLNFQADMPLQLHVSCTDYAEYAPALVTMSTWLRGCACTGAMAIGLFFVGVCQKYCQEKLEFILSATKAAAVRQVGCPKIEDVAPLVHCTSYFHWISHLKLSFGKCWMFPREQFCFGPSTESTGPAISHLIAAHYPGSVGARRYARSKGIEIPDAGALKCRHFCIASEALVVNWILNIYISHHITYLIVDFL